MTKEFTLSTEVPSGVKQGKLAAARADWQRRSDEAAAKIKVPDAPFRIRGDSEAGRWFVEEAAVIRSDMPRDDRWAYMMPAAVIDDDGEMHIRYIEPDRTPVIKKLNEDEPTAKLEWQRIGRRNKGWMTYAKAARWLKEWLEPVRDESVYFRPDGHEA